MTTRRSIVIGSLITVATAAYSAVMYPQLSKLGDKVPTHWNAAGQVDAYGSKWTTLLMLPCMMVVFSVLMLVLPYLSPKKFEVTTFRTTYNYIWVLILGMFTFLHVAIIQATLHEAFPITRAMMAVLFIFFALLGNVLGKVKRNFYMGIRTPWTLADERVWDLTHRSAARLWTIGGVIGFLVALFGAPFWLSFSLLMAMALVPVVQSFFFYQKVDRGGQIAGPGV